MHNADIPLREVREGMFLLLGGHPLIDERVGLHFFCEPVAVVAVHFGRSSPERSVLRDGGTVVRAAGYDRPTGREIAVEVAGRILILFPDDRHLVAGINIPDPPSKRARNVAPHSTGPSGKGLVEYRLPGFWRDASSVVSGLPEAWFGRVDHPPLGADTLDMAEALGGVVSPSSTDLPASETAFFGGVTVGTAVLCWAAACGLEDLNPWAIDGTLVAPASMLVTSFGSPGALRSALLSFVGGRLASEMTDHEEYAAFEVARTQFAARLARGGP